MTIQLRTKQKNNFCRLRKIVTKDWVGFERRSDKNTLKQSQCLCNAKKGLLSIFKMRHPIASYSKCDFKTPHSLKLKRYETDDLMSILIRSEPLAFSLHCGLATERPSILESRSPGCQKSDCESFALLVWLLATRRARFSYLRSFLRYRTSRAKALSVRYLGEYTWRLKSSGSLLTKLHYKVTMLDPTSKTLL